MILEIKKVNGLNSQLRYGDSAAVNDSSYRQDGERQIQNRFVHGLYTVIQNLG